MKLFMAMVILLGMLSVIACSRSPDFGTATAPGSIDSTIEVSSNEEVQYIQESNLEYIAKDLGIIIDDEGHLLVEGRPKIRILRLLSYFNVEARLKESDREGLIYKISGFYESSRGNGGFIDNVGYNIQISTDDFSAPVDLPMFAQERELDLGENGYLSANHEDPYAALSQILAYRNAEAVNAGRDYKLKAWYSTEDTEDTILSDSVDVIIQFSFDEKIKKPTTDLAHYVRNISAVELRQKAIIATSAVDFSQLLTKPGGLNILSLDFSGDSGQGPSLVYLFDDQDVEILKDIREGRLNWDVTEILALAEVKEPRLNFSVSGVFTDQPNSSEEKVERSEEPIGQDAIEIVARIVVETARVINPTDMSIVVYEFEGASPTRLTTWSYIFDREAIEILRNESLSPEATLRLASISEGVAIIPGDRRIPSFK